MNLCLIALKPQLACRQDPIIRDTARSPQPPPPAHCPLYPREAPVPGPEEPVLLWFPGGLADEGLRSSTPGGSAITITGLVCPELASWHHPCQPPRRTSACGPSLSACSARVAAVLMGPCRHPLGGHCGGRADQGVSRPGPLLCSLSSAPRGGRDHDPHFTDTSTEAQSPGHSPPAEAPFQGSGQVSRL